MSPRAACRLITLGFVDVHDYVAGKLDWLARNMPVEGTEADAPTIGRYLHHDIAMAHPDELVGAVRDRAAQSGHTFVLVTIGGVLLGRIRGNTLTTADPGMPVGEVMEAGPSTLRPHESAAKISARLAERNLNYVIVTDPDGRLLGTVRAADLPTISTGHTP